MPKIDVDKAPAFKGSSYPKPFDKPCRERTGRRLGVAAGLTQFGVNLVTLKPGAWSSQRHWHEHEDEFVYIISGELVLIEDDGETLLGPGNCVGWKAGVHNGHHLVNRSSADAVFLAIGTRNEEDWGEYPDIDLKFNPGLYQSGGGPAASYSHKDGTPY